MMPAYRSDVFARAVVPVVHQMDFMSSGWGVEIMIGKLAEAHLRRAPRMFVLDEDSAIHSRPVGRNKAIHERGQLEWFLVPQQQWMAYMETEHVFSSLDEAVVATRVTKRPRRYGREQIGRGLARYRTLYRLYRPFAQAQHRLDRAAGYARHIGRRLSEVLASRLGGAGTSGRSRG